MIIIKVFQVADFYEEATWKICKERMNRSYFGGIALGLSNAIMFLSYSLLFWLVSYQQTMQFVHLNLIGRYGSRLIIKGEISFEQMLTAMLGLLLGALGLGQALNDIGDQKEGIAAAKRIFDVIDASKASPIDGLSKQGEIPTNSSEGSIVLRGVNFHYPTRPDAKVCKDYDLTIEKGEVVALVGPSGSGKSTIINLLLRFYDPVQGEIFLDGKDLRSYNVRWLRSQIG